MTKDRIFRWPAKKIVRSTSTVTLHELSYLKNSIVHRRDTIETVTTSVVQWLTCLPGVWKIMGPDQKLWNYTPTHREGAILQSPCPLSVRSHFRNRYLSFYWKKWFYIWYMALAWWLVPCLPFPGLPHIYFLFTVRLTNERVGVFLARRSVQHLVVICCIST